MGLVLGHAYTIVSEFLLRWRFLIGQESFSKLEIHGERNSGLEVDQIVTSNSGVKFRIVINKGWAIHRKTMEYSSSFGKIF